MMSYRVFVSRLLMYNRQKNHDYGTHSTAVSVLKATALHHASINRIQVGLSKAITKEHITQLYKKVTVFRGASEL